MGFAIPDGCEAIIVLVPAKSCVTDKEKVFL